METPYMYIINKEEKPKNEKGEANEFIIKRNLV
jgi:hypothetical protein